MKGRRYVTLGVLCLLVLACLCSGVLAVPRMINYQGMVTDQDGIPFSGAFAMRFYLYDVPSGGSPLWGEEQSVSVTDGIYNVQLGSTAPLTEAAFSGDGVYLEVRFYNPDTSGWETFTPRQRITSVAYALRAGDADTLGGLDASALDQSAHVADKGNPHGVTPAQIGAATTSALSSHAANASAHHTRYSDAEAVAAVKASDGAGSGLDADLLDGLNSTQFASSSHNHDSLYYSKAYVDQLQTRIAALETMVNEVLSRFQGVTRAGSEITFSGMNVRVVNGLSNTETTNALGNLIIGYNETRAGTGGVDVRTGSHNLIVGKQHNFSRYGGILAGRYNEISGNYSSVSGGWGNKASGEYSSVSGGGSNTASASGSSISGGNDNKANSNYASVSGGNANIASGFYASVSGGQYNKASGEYSFVGGGGGEASTYAIQYNEAFANHSSILGGQRNLAGDGSDHAIGKYSSVSGGWGNIASGEHSSVSGGGSNTASSIFSSVSGGVGNNASSAYASVSGGNNNTASGWLSSVSGGAVNTASGHSSSVSGGFFNTASGYGSSVSGGENNVALGDRSFIGGGGNIDPVFGNKAYANYSAILGGGYNITGVNGAPDTGAYSTISGGNTNKATGTFSTVSGGRNNDSSGWYSSVSGGNNLDTSLTDGWRAPGH